MLILVALCLVVFPWIVLIRIYARQRSSPKKPEPPVVHTKVPLVGHILSMIWYRRHYYAQLREKCQLPIVTLPILGTKVYVVFSMPNHPVCPKAKQNLVFQPVQAKFSVKLCGASKDARTILQEDMDPDNGKFGNIYTAMHHVLNPGKPLDELNRAMISHVCERVQSIQRHYRSLTNLLLFQWLRHNVTLATTDAVYGPHNPFQDGKVEKAFWVFEREIPKLIFLPGWLAWSGSRSRKEVADAFMTFYSKGYHHHASTLVKDFHACETSYGFSLSDRSRFEVGQALAILGNTSAAVFWMIFYVFSNPDALRDIRQEIRTLITTSEDEANRITHFIDMTKLNSNCPLLVSTFREMMRLHSIGISLRQVCQDTILNGTYHLQKGATILMPTVAIHTDHNVWGSDVLAFDYRRFHPSNSHKVSPAAFRSFGGGTTLCPGRHFATMQVMTWTIRLVMRFELKPVKEDHTEGKWVQPTTDKSNLANVIMMPDHDVPVKVSARSEYTAGTWSLKVADTEMMFGVTVEDFVEEVH